MILLKVLFISAFALLELPQERSVFAPQDPCEKLTLATNVTKSETTGSKVEIVVKGGTEPYKYIFYKESGQLVSSEFDKNTVDGLQTGKYACTVSDKNNCKKSIEIEIK
jgi:hypothetical protein